jgi:triphosphoribosyl-dephospho-CoA synthase
VLQGLDLEDSRAAFRAIQQANPGGLGAAEAEDVHDEPQLGLRQAMALAAERDSIARLYAQGFTELLELDWPHLPAPVQTSPAPDPPLTAAVQHLYLQILARWPDSHIVRKHGLAAAQGVSAQARLWQAQPQPEHDPAFALWDQTLKLAGLNPGTSADMTVATLMWAGLVPRPAAPWHGS